MGTPVLFPFLPNISQPTLYTPDLQQSVRTAGCGGGRGGRRGSHLGALRAAGTPLLSSPLSSGAGARPAHTGAAARARCPPAAPQVPPGDRRPAARPVTPLDGRDEFDLGLASPCREAGRPVTPPSGPPPPPPPPPPPLQGCRRGGTLWTHQLDDPGQRRTASDG